MIKALAVFLLLLAAAFLWLTSSILDSESRRISDARQARLLEQARFSLWRMDASLTPLLFIENNRPPGEFFAKPSDRPSPTGRIQTSDLTSLLPLMPSIQGIIPAFPEDSPPDGLSPFSCLYFQIDPAGDLSSPQSAPYYRQNLASLQYSGLASKFQAILGSLPPGGAIAQNPPDAAHPPDQAQASAGTSIESPPPAAREIPSAPPAIGNSAPAIANSPPTAAQPPPPTTPQATPMSDGKVSDFALRRDLLPKTQVESSLRNSLGKPNSRPRSAQPFLSPQDFHPQPEPQDQRSIARKSAPAIPEDAYAAAPESSPGSASAESPRPANADSPASPAIVPAIPTPTSSPLAGSAARLPEQSPASPNAQSPPRTAANQVPSPSSRAMDKSALPPSPGSPQSADNRLISPPAPLPAQPQLAAEAAPALPTVSITAFQPSWFGDRLFLLRRVLVDDKAWIQGIWIDWPKLSRFLLDRNREALPTASLQPVPDNIVTPAISPLALASLPVTLDPGNLSTPEPSPWSRLRTPVLVSWGCFIAASIGLLWLAIAIRRLGERRAAFVSAVTHELRSPLTTFGMYTEMLQAGLVPKSRIPLYYATLQRESSRLSRLIDNVLAFSRIEKSRPSSSPVPVPLATLASSLRDRICDHLLASGMDLQVILPESLSDLIVLTDLTTLEQIIFNLADNSTKYGQNPNPDLNSATLAFQTSRKHLVIEFRDAGSGIDPAFCRDKLFLPFSRSAEDAAGKKPGVGLGLALSHRLAQSLGGRLELASSSASGTTFRLTLPLK